MTESDEAEVLPQVSETNRGIEPSSEALRILRSLFRDEYDTYRHERRYNIPFEVEQEDVRQLDEVAREQFVEAGHVNEVDDVVFTAEIVYADSSSDRYLDINSLLRDGGEYSNPERMSLLWSAMVSQPPGAMAKIEAVFTTEKEVAADEKQFGSSSNSYIASHVTGVTSEWPRQVATRLSSRLQALEIGGIYKPLYIFRYKEFVFFAALMISLFFRGLAERFLRRRAIDIERINAERAQLRAEILEAGTLEERFDAFVNYQLSDVSLSDFGGDLQAQAGGLAAMLIALVASAWLLPKLVPRSFIGIGIARKKMYRYRTTFNFVVFTVGIIGIALPVIRAVILF